MLKSEQSGEWFREAASHVFMRRGKSAARECYG